MKCWSRGNPRLPFSLLLTLIKSLQVKILCAWHFECHQNVGPLTIVVRPIFSSPWGHNGPSPRQKFNSSPGGVSVTRADSAFTWLLRVWTARFKNINYVYYTIFWLDDRANVSKSKSFEIHVQALSDRPCLVYMSLWQKVVCLTPCLFEKLSQSSNTTNKQNLNCVLLSILWR